MAADWPFINPYCLLLKLVINKTLRNVISIMSMYCYTTANTDEVTKLFSLQPTSCFSLPLAVTWLKAAYYKTDSKWSSVEDFNEVKWFADRTREAIRDRRQRCLLTVPSPSQQCTTLQSPYRRPSCAPHHQLSPSTPPTGQLITVVQIHAVAHTELNFHFLTKTLTNIYQS